MKTSNKLLISILGIISLLTLLYFLTPIRYLFYKSPPSQTTTNAENPNWADSESPSLIQKSEIEIYNSLIRDSYITISKYYQIAKPSELKAEIISKSIEFVKQLENIEDRNLNFAQSIEKYYIIGNLLLCAADLETKNEQKIFLSDLSIKSIAIAMNFIQESKNSDPLAYQWALEENMEDRLLFYTTLNLCIKKIAGETIDKKEILEPLNSILKEKRDKYNLDNHRLILGALDELKQINDINKTDQIKKGDTNE